MNTSEAFGGTAPTAWIGHGGAGHQTGCSGLDGRQVGVQMSRTLKCPLAWLAIGIRVLDTGSGRIGVVQLLRDDVGSVRTGVIERPTHVLLRPVGGREPLWWAPVSSLEELLRRPR
jgi:hypothetical protein